MKSGKNIKGLIFDLDGTLLDTLTSLWYCSKCSLEQEGLKPLPRENFRYYVGDGALKQVERYLKDTEIADPLKLPPDPHDPANLEYYYKSYMDFLDRYSDYEVRPYEGIPELLKELKDEGLRLAVFSNKPDRAAAGLIKKFFGSTFDIVYGKKEGLPKKPDPKVALLIAEEFKLKPEEIMYLGDTDTDMKTGKNAGMFTVGVLWGFRDMEELLKNGADALVSRPSDIKSLLEFQR